MRDTEYYENLVRSILDEDDGLSLDDDDVQDALDDFVKRLMEIDGGAPNPYIIDGLGSTGEDDDEDEYEEDYDDDDSGGDDDSGEEGDEGDNDDDDSSEEGGDDDGGGGLPSGGEDSDGSVKDDTDKPPSGKFKKDGGTVSDRRMKKKAPQEPDEGFSQKNIVSALRDLRF